MVSTYTGTGRLTKQGTDDNPSTWGEILNDQVIELLDEFIAGVVDVDITGTSNVTLTTSNGSTDQARHAVVELTGTLGANIDVLIPALEKKYYFRAGWTGAYNVNVKISGSSTEVLIRPGEKKILYSNGTDVYDMVDTGTSITDNDTTPGQLNDKLTVTAPLEKATVNPSGNESLNLTLDDNYNVSALGGHTPQYFTPSGANDIVISTGSYSTEEGDYMNLDSTLTKGINGSWVAGDGNGGLDTGTVVADTTYYVFLILNPSSGATDALFSASRSSPTLPSGYTKKRLVGYVQTNGSSVLDTWAVVWTAFGPTTAPSMWLIADVNSSNIVTQVYFTFGLDPASTSARVRFSSAGALFATDDITAFSTS